MAAAGAVPRAGSQTGILELDDAPSVWLAREEFVGPDGVARERHGRDRLAGGDARMRREASFPHERTHPHIREERRRLLQETRVQPEPILLLADTSFAPPLPEARPDLAVDGTRLWRLPADAADGLRDAELLIADGHHRYESAVELGEELGAPVRIMALVVPTDDAGLQLFPTHRVFSGRPDLASGADDEAASSLEDALARLEDVGVRARGGGQVSALLGRPRHTVAKASSTSSSSIATASTESATRLSLEEALAEVDSGAADAAFVLRRPRVEDVFAVARRGEPMPPKSTYFFPKPLSGLLFHPVTP